MVWEVEVMWGDSGIVMMMLGIFLSVALGGATIAVGTVFVWLIACLGKETKRVVTAPTDKLQISDAKAQALVKAVREYDYEHDWRR
jgi:hypothetical protein